MSDYRQLTCDHRQNSSGQIAILAIVFLAVMIILIGSLYSRLGNFLFSGKSSVEKEQVLQLAEAGIDKAIWELNQTGGSYTGETDSAFGSGTFTVEVTTIDPSTKKIESSAYIPNAVNPLKSKKITVRARTQNANVSFLYGVQVGAGGLTMSNNSQITGNVYSNGSIGGTNNTTITGDVFVAAGTGTNPNQENLTQSLSFSVGDLSSRTDAGQSFTVSDQNIITKVALYIRKIGNPSNATIRIAEDDSGKPKTTALTSGTLNASNVTTNYGWVEVTFSANPTLDSSKTYWLILDVGNANGTRYFVWGQSEDGNYPNGTGKYASNWSSATAVWSDTGGDFDFKVWLGNSINVLDGISSIGGNVHANTINNTTISGAAYYQTITNSTAASYNPDSPDPPPEAMPISDGQVDDWKTSAENGGVHTGDYTSCVSSAGPLKITGNLTLSNGCALTVTGTIWVQGNITLSNNITVRLDPGYGSDSGIIVSDGIININNNIQVQGSGQSGSYILILSTSNSVSPAAVTINNNAGGNGLIYASSGLIDVFNNNGFKEVTGYALRLNNNSGVTYESGLASAQFSSGPGGSWQVQKKTWQILPF